MFLRRNINNQSLTIIDELGRGTSSRDGLAIALAISEALIQSDSIVWFATHFQELGEPHSSLSYRHTNPTVIHSKNTW